MITCPACETPIGLARLMSAKRRINAAVKAAQVKTGSQGGKAGTGAAKRRDVDYRALGLMGAEARRKAREA